MRIDTLLPWLAIATAAAMACSGCASVPEGRAGSPDRAHPMLLPSRRISTDALPLVNRSRNPVPPRTLFLTYDDGPDLYTLEIATFLAKEGIRATFFVNGCRFVGQPEPKAGSACATGGSRFDPSLIERLIALGHRVGNHTQDHVNLTTLAAIETDEPDPRVMHELSRTQALLDRYIRDGLYLFRAPYGAWAGLREGRDTSTSADLGRLIGSMGIDIDGADWDCPSRGLSPTECADRYVERLAERPRRNGIIGLHDANANSRGTDYAYRLTRELVARLPRGRRADQYVFAPLDALPGVMGQKAMGTPQPWPHREGVFSNGGGWNERPSYYRTIRLARIAGGDRDHACGRGASGIHCTCTGWGGGVGPGRSPEGCTPVHSPVFSNTLGWLPPEYGTTVQFGDVDGDGRDDVCGRGRAGVFCALSMRNVTFGEATRWSIDFSDLQGWSAMPSYYGSIRLSDVNGDGKADLCGRAPAGILCALSTGTSFSRASSWTGIEFTDALGWAPEEYGSTIMFGDVDGDGRDDVCGRGPDGIVCAPSNGDGFGPPRHWTDFGGVFSDRDGWGSSRSKYGSLRLGDVDGDGKADLCGRNETGVVCATSDGVRFRDYVYVRNDEFTDALGWDRDEHGTTLQMGELNGDRKADVCLRGATGLVCMLSR